MLGTTLVILMVIQAYAGTYEPSPERLSLALGNSCEAWQSLWDARNLPLSRLQTRLEYLKPLIDDLRPWTGTSADVILRDLQQNSGRDFTSVLVDWSMADTIAVLRVAYDKTITGRSSAAEGWFEVAQCNWNLLTARVQENSPTSASEIKQTLADMHELLAKGDEASMADYNQKMQSLAKLFASLGQAQKPSSNLPPVVLEIETDQKKLNFVGPCRFEYPSALRSLRVSGMVIYRVLVRSDGTPERVEILRTPHPLLGQTVESTIKKCRYIPPTYQGKPISAWVNSTVNFQP